ncbi:low molecular weight phosphotyrosine protein phosphatase [Catenovulum sp. SM1970]|nr:low molecular weight phosphotyrosine protein phosphatase [Marinifaba aquimaris]
MRSEKVNSVLFICYANICRSTTAEAVFRQKAQQAGLKLKVSSAGTHASNKGNPPDSRSVDAGRQRRYDFTDIASRRVTKEDFEEYDLILVMDSNNFNSLLAKCPFEQLHKIEYFLSFAKLGRRVRDIPDPYYAGVTAFEKVLDLIEQSSDGLIHYLKENRMTPNLSDN